MAESDHGNPQVFPTRRSYRLLALGFIAFVLYGSLIPFDFSRVPLLDAWEEFRRVLVTWPERRISRSDVLANTLLFVPVGFTLAGAILTDRHARWWCSAVPFTLLTSLALSVTAEFLQMFASHRVPSALDVGAQLAGALVGLALWLAVGQPITRWVRETRAAVADDRLSRLLLAYAAAWMFVSLAPFDITVDMGDLAERVRAARISIVPFGEGERSWARRLWGGFMETGAAIPLGVLAAVHRSRSASGRGGPAILATLGALLLVLVVESAQVFIRSHSATTTDLIFGWLGVAVGVVVGRRLRATSPNSAIVDVSGQRAFLLLGLALGAAVTLCAYQWQPYNFVLDTDLVRAKLARMSLVPFAAHMAGSYVNTFNTILVDLSLAATLGFTTAVAVGRLGASRRVTATIVVVAAAAVHTAIEIGQFFLPTRTPDPTDVLLGVAAAFVAGLLGTKN